MSSSQAFLIFELISYVCESIEPSINARTKKNNPLLASTELYPLCDKTISKQQKNDKPLCNVQCIAISCATYMKNYINRKQKAKSLLYPLKSNLPGIEEISLTSSSVVRV